MVENTIERCARAIAGVLWPEVPWEKMDEDGKGYYREAARACVAAQWQPIETAPFDTKVTLATSGGWVGDAFRYDKETINTQDEWVWSDTGSVVRHQLIAWQPLPPHPDQIAAVLEGKA